MLWVSSECLACAAIKLLGSRCTSLGEQWSGQGAVNCLETFIFCWRLVPRNRRTKSGRNCALVAVGELIRLDRIENFTAYLLRSWRSKFAVSFIPTVTIALSELSARKENPSFTTGAASLFISKIPAALPALRQAATTLVKAA